MKTIFAAFCIFQFIFMSCSPIAKIISTNLNNITEKSSDSWTLEDCENVLKFYKSRNYSFTWDDQIVASDDVLIEAIPLNKPVIEAIVRKEALNRRLSDKEYFQTLNNYLTEYSDYRYDSVKKEIIKEYITTNKGYSFQLVFQNNTSPYKPLILESGYDYFFLENPEGKFSRVVEVSGLFADEVFQLDSYLPVTLTYSQLNDEGLNLYENGEIISEYKLVFNGLQTNPIEILWQVKGKK